MGVSQAKPSEYVEPQWIADSDTDNCFHCLEKFSLTKRRHHCRCCGEVFCAKCWGKTVQLPPYYRYSDPQPVCVACHAFFAGNLKKMQMPRYVALLRQVKGVQHTPGPPMLAENVRPPTSMADLEEEDREREREAAERKSKRQTTVACNRLSSSPRGVDSPDSSLSKRKSCKPQKAYVEICSIKLGDWRPVNKNTCIHFCRTPTLANEVAFSSRQLSQEKDSFSMPTPNDSPDSENTFRAPKKTVADHIRENKDFKEATWTLNLDGVLHAVLDFSVDHGMDYITIETAQEFFYVQAIAPLGMGGSGGSSRIMLGEVESEAEHFEPSGQSTIALFKELKELLAMMEVRVTKRDQLYEQGLIGPPAPTPLEREKTGTTRRRSGSALTPPPTSAEQPARFRRVHSAQV